MEDRDPMEGDEIRALFNGDDIDDIVQPENYMLTEILEHPSFEGCEELIPFANRILWLSAVKEAVGYIPDYICMDYEELRGLVVLQEERDKKMAMENYKMRRETDRQRQSSSSTPIITKR